MIKGSLAGLIKMISLNINQFSLSLDSGQRTCDLFYVLLFCSPEWCILTEKICHLLLMTFSQHTMIMKTDRKKTSHGFHLTQLRRYSNLLSQLKLLLPTQSR